METSPLGGRRADLSWLVIGLIAPALVHALLYSGSSAMQDIAFDTRVTYIPLAEWFLRDARELFVDPEHLKVGPGSFVYMALLGADVATIVKSNLVLSVCVLLLLADTARRVAGRMAASAAAWLTACSPLLPTVLLPALSEPPHLLFIALWLWASSVIWASPSRWLQVLIGGGALAAAILTRATYLYWIPAAIGASALLQFAPLQQVRSGARSVLMMHVVAALIAGAYMFHSYSNFGVPVIATGSGAALYFGSNAAINGYEPPYYNLLHDHWLIAGEHSHLSIEGDRRLKSAAVAMLADMPVSTFVSMALQKSGATLFFSKATLLDQPFNQRAWRILLLMLAMAGLLRYRKAPFIWMLGCVLLYHIAIMVLVMHNARYSIGAIEVPLTLCASLGVAALAASPLRLKWVGCFVVAVLAAIGGGALHQRMSPPLMPALDDGMHRVAAAPSEESLEISGFEGDPVSDSGGVVNGDAKISWRDVQFERIGGSPIVAFRLDALGDSCRAIKLRYIVPGYDVLVQTIHVDGLRAPRLVALGTLGLNSLEPSGVPGIIEIGFDCQSGARVAIDELRLEYLRTGHYYRDLLTNE